jgi:hypothetical protein
LPCWSFFFLEREGSVGGSEGDTPRKRARGYPVDWSVGVLRSFDKMSGFPIGAVLLCARRLDGGRPSRRNNKV